MIFKDIYACSSAISFLENSIISNRISHAQLFVGKPGFGTLVAALAYAKHILCKTNQICQQKVNHLQHPDIHFSIPTFKLDNKEALTKNYLSEFKTLINNNYYADLNDWYQTLEAGNKQGFLSKNEIVEVMNTLSIKSFEGGYKVHIIWYADKMKVEFANRFLKLLEEPPPKTLFLLLTDNLNGILETIRSRCQTLLFKPLTNLQIQEYLIANCSVSEEEAIQISHLSNGDLHNALQVLNGRENIELFEQEFVSWTRNAFLAKTKPIYLKELIQQGEKIGSWNKEQQKQYVKYCLETFRQALLQNYNALPLVNLNLNKEGFNFNKFSEFISGKNIQDILLQLNNTYFYLERNANSKLTFINLGIMLTRYIHRK